MMLIVCILVSVDATSHLLKFSNIYSKRTNFRMGVFDQTIVIFLVSTFQIVWHSYGLVLQVPKC